MFKRCKNSLSLSLSLLLIFSVVSITFTACDGGSSSDDGGSGGGTTLSWVTVFEDNFNRADSTNDLGTDWVIKTEDVHDYKIEIVSGRVSFKSLQDGPSPKITSSDEIIVDNNKIRISFELETAFDKHLRAMIRCVDSSGNAFGVGSNDTQIFFTNTAGNEVAATNLSLAVSTVYFLEFIIDSGNYTCNIKNSSGDILKTITTTGVVLDDFYMVLGAGNWNNLTSSGTASYIDNFKVEKY